MATNLPPVPYKTPVSDEQGILTQPWQGFYRQLVQVILAASQINATTAAAQAQAAQTAAASSALVATARASDASASAAQAQLSATSALNSASSAASSLQSMISLGAAQAYPSDYIDTTITVPVHRQMITFQRMTITATGSLQILGRGRIL